MPKLSENALAKRFACSECGKSFRTRQGLSGHIRFKHPILQVIPEVSSAASQKSLADSIELSDANLILESKKLQQQMLAVGYSEGESLAFAGILARWILVKSRAKNYKVDVSPQDYRAYILTSVARWFEFEDYKKELDGMFQKHVNRLLETINNAIK